MRLSLPRVLCRRSVPNGCLRQSISRLLPKRHRLVGIGISRHAGDGSNPIADLRSDETKSKPLFFLFLVACLVAETETTKDYCGQQEPEELAPTTNWQHHSPRRKSKLRDSDHRQLDGISDLILVSSVLRLFARYPMDWRLSTHPVTRDPEIPDSKPPA